MTRAALATLALIILSSPALADVPPPPGYVEQCTTDKQKQAGEECVSCGTYHGEPDKCDKLYAPAGYDRRCRTRGASVWSEVWCRKLGTGKPVVDDAEVIKAPAPTPPTPDEPTPAPTPDEPPPAPTPTADAPTPTPADAPKVDDGAPSTVIPAPPTEPTPAPAAVTPTPATPTPPATPEATKKSGCAGAPMTTPLAGLLALFALLALRRRRSATRA